MVPPRPPGSASLEVPRALSAAAPGGRAWIVEARGCDPERLRSIETLAALFDALVLELGLHPLRPPVFERFPGAGGVTGYVLLAESHLAAHTFPESGAATFDLYCCRARPEWSWRAELETRLGARVVDVRTLARLGADGRRADDGPTSTEDRA